MKQGKRKGSKRIKKEDMLASVVEFFNQDRKRAFNYKQVAHGVGATTTPQKQMVFQLLEGMAEQNFLIEVSPGKYKANSRGTEVIGRFERRVNGKNHVITDDDESIFIAERNAMHAMDGDRVRVLVYAKRRGHDAEGEVVEIVEKTPQIFVGTLEVQKHFAFLLTDNKVLANDIFIPKTAHDDAPEALTSARNAGKSRFCSASASAAARRFSSNTWMARSAARSPAAARTAGRRR